MGNKKLSIIVPAYNAEQYIEECILSIINQDYHNIEVIIVDDGSTDSSHEICSKLSLLDNRVKYIFQENKGVIEARKKGVFASSGDYICFVDADDFVLHKAYSYAEEAMDSDVDMILFAIARYFDEDNIKVDSPKVSAGRYDRKEIEAVIFPQLIWNFDRKCPGMEPQLGVNIIKRSLIVEQYEELTENFWYGEDMALIYPIYLKANNLQIFDDYYYMHRQRNCECWPYVKSNNYFTGLAELYHYLIKEFNELLDKHLLRKQIEYWYMYATQLKKVSYGESHIDNFLFPFDKVEKGRKIILYGAGNVGRTYYNQLVKLNYCEKIIWVDKKYKLLNDERIKSPEIIKKENFDYFVIAIENISVCKQIKCEYIKKCIDKNAIVY